jgi:hypothetical protein
MRKLALVGVIVVLLAASAVGQEAVEIKFYQPKVGDRVKVTVEEQTETKTTQFVKGRNIERTKKKARSFVYVDEILAVAEGAPKVTKLKRTYAKATSTEGDKTTTLPVEGQTVLIEWKDSKYGFTLRGMPVAGEAGTLLDAEFNLPEQLGPRLLIPKSVKPGDAWKLDAAQSFAGLDADKSIRGLNGAKLYIDKARLVATGKLVKTHQVGDAQFGEFELKATAPVLHNPKMLRQSLTGDRAVTVSADLCVNGVSPEARTKVVQRTAFKWTSVDTGIEVDSTVTKISTTKLVKP